MEKIRGKIRVKISAFNVDLLEHSTRAIVKAAKDAGAKISGPIPLPTRINKFTVLRSPHVNKKSREQFEMRSHKRLVDIIEPSDAVMNALMNLELPPGVDIDIKEIKNN